MSTIVPLEGFGGGGNAANPELRIVGGTTRPAKAAQNMIWINTDVEITEVTFAAENPYIVKSGNLYVAATDPGYIDSNGNVQPLDGWKVTPYIELPDGTQNVTTTMSSATSNTCHAFYDASKNFLSTVYRKPNTYAYAVPANAKYIRMSERLSEATTLIASYTKDVPEGAAWITIGNSSGVKMASPVGGDWITVYPLSAKQYVGGAWVDKTAKNYQGVEWVDWIVWLVGNGVDLSTTLGTFSNIDSGQWSYTGGVLKLSRQQQAQISYGPSDVEYDLTNLKELIINITAFSTGDNTTVLGVANKGSSGGFIASVTPTGVGEYIIDISAINQKAVFACQLSYKGCSVTISEMYMR